MDETALNQALGSIQLSLSVIVREINQGSRTIKAQAMEIESLKAQLATKESAVEQATRQAGRPFNCTPPAPMMPPIGKVENPVYPEAQP